MIRRAAVLAIRLYQTTLGRALPPRCRFDPSCSERTRRAIAAHGLRKGLAAGLSQLLRCHPWGASRADRAEAP